MTDFPASQYDFVEIKLVKINLTAKRYGKSVDKNFVYIYHTISILHIELHKYVEAIFQPLIQSIHSNLLAEIQSFLLSNCHHPRMKMNNHCSHI